MMMIVELPYNILLAKVCNRLLVILQAKEKIVLAWPEFVMVNELGLMRYDSLIITDSYH